MSDHKQPLTRRYAPVRQRGRVVGFQVLSEECIWMRAGVVNYRICDNAFDCSSCAFDKGMRRALADRRHSATGLPKQAPEHWATVLGTRYSGMERPCRHVLTGRVASPKSCPLNYECHHCAFDQWVADTEDLVQEANRPTTTTITGVPVAQNYYYHSGHSWVRFEHGGRLRVGMDGFIAHLFGALDKIGLPALGSDLDQAEVGWRIHRHQHAADVQAPVSGTVVARNPVIIDHPDMAHHDPYQHGWLLLMEVPHPRRCLKHLMADAQVFDWMEGESRGLMELLGDDYVALAATGGRLIDDLVGKVASLDWDSLAARFLQGKR
ncbi:MAG: glycine cleavage system protein H [Desulfosarcinaceae bacterium]